MYLLKSSYIYFYKLIDLWKGLDVLTLFAVDGKFLQILITLADGCLVNFQPEFICGQLIPNS